MEPFHGPLVSQRWVRQRPANEVAIADVRWVRGGSARAAFVAGHLPDAVSLDLDADLAAPAFEGPGRHPLPTPEAFAAAMGRAGITDGTPVVVYDDVRGSVAARLWWMLDAIGHPVALLDGGLGAWDGPIETGPGRKPPEALFTPRPWPVQRIVDAADVVRTLLSGDGIVVDARAAERYRGEVEPIDPVPGHIPGARSVTLDAEPGSRDGDVPALRRAQDRGSRRWASPTRARTIAHCGSGVTACHAIIAMRLAGMGDARLYEGSWSDWISDPARPVRTGAEPGALG